MTPPSWLRAKIHSDNGSVVNGNYTEVEVAGGQFSVHAEGWLTASRTRVMVLGALGLHTQESAEMLYLSPHTVHTHRERIYRKLEVDKMAQAIGACFAPDKAIFRTETPPELPAADDIDMELIGHIACGMTYQQAAVQMSADAGREVSFDVVKERARETLTVFEQASMTGVLTVCHLAGLLGGEDE